MPMQPTAVVDQGEWEDGVQDLLCMVLETARKVVPALSLIVTVGLQDVWLCRFLIVTTCGFAERTAICDLFSGNES